MFDRYVIKKGDSLNNIAKKFNTNKEIIKDINDIYYDDLIRAGMEIVVPKKTDEYFNFYTMKKGDTLYQVALKYDVNPELLASLNGLNITDYFYSGQEILIPKRDYSYYVTKDGDTLNNISNTFNSKVDNLIRENKTIYLMPGQVMVSKRQN